MFAAPSLTAVARIRQTLEDALGIHAFVLCMGDGATLASIGALARPVLDREFAALMMRALPDLDRDPQIAALLTREGSEAPFRDLFAPGLRPLLEMALRARASVPDRGVDADLRDSFEVFHRRPEVHDPLWLSLFRILPARMGRGHQFAARVLYCSLDEPAVVLRACQRLGDVGDSHGLHHAFGYLVPLEGGTRAVMEYDLYFDPTEPMQLDAIRAAVEDARLVERELCASADLVCSGESVRQRGLCRPATYLFGRR
jgi:hypothetical protein